MRYPTYENSNRYPYPSFIEYDWLMRVIQAKEVRCEGIAESYTKLSVIEELHWRARLKDRVGTIHLLRNYDTRGLYTTLVVHECVVLRLWHSLRVG